MIGIPFLTEIDPRAKIKGSRDPLGLQPIWTRLGRRIISNLTTVTTSVRNFTTLLQGFYFVERAIQESGADASEFANLFLKYEQLAAYSRVVYGSAQDSFDEEEVRGIRRVERNLTGKKIRISAKQEWQILSNQKTYGLWGLFTSAARSSGWISQNGAVPFLTLETRAFIESEYISRFPRKGDPILNFVVRDQEFDPKGKDSIHAKTIAQTLTAKLSSAEKNFYHHHLIACKSEGLQQLLWERMKEVNQSRKFNLDEPFSVEELRELIKRCRTSNDEVLADKLNDIRIAESVIAPIGKLFGFILSRDSQSIPEVASEIRSEWGPRLNHIEANEFTRVLETMKDLPTEVRSPLNTASVALSNGEYDQVIRSLLEQNAIVMKGRKSEAWVREKGKKLDVRVGDESGELPGREELKNLWASTYFINSFKRIGYQIWGR